MSGMPANQHLHTGPPWEVTGPQDRGGCHRSLGKKRLVHPSLGIGPIPAPSSCWNSKTVSFLSIFCPVALGGVPRFRLGRRDANWASGAILALSFTWWLSAYPLSSLLMSAAGQRGFWACASQGLGDLALPGLSLLTLPQEFAVTPSAGWLG